MAYHVLTWMAGTNPAITALATVKRFNYETHEQLQNHLPEFVGAYNFARWLKTLRGFMLYEFICKRWTSEPHRFIRDPLHQMLGLNI
jgi:hypothetical protein